MTTLEIAVIVLAVVQTLHLVVIAVQTYATLRQIGDITDAAVTTTKIQAQSYQMDVDALEKQRCQEAEWEQQRKGPDLGVAADVIPFEEPPEDSR